MLVAAGPSDMNYVSGLATLPDGGIVTATTANPDTGSCKGARSLSRRRRRAGPRSPG